MNNQVVVHRSETVLSLEDVNRLPWVTLPADWTGEPIENPPSYHLAIDPKTLWFGARRNAAPFCDTSIPGGTFIEGLWEKDCAEIFITVPGTSAYYEFNFSPSGAWWGCAFGKYRERLSPQPARPTCVMQSLYTERSWHIVAAIEKATLPLELGKHLDGRNLKANVTFILQKPRELFVTAQKLPCEKIDFHRLHELGAVAEA